VSSKLEEKKGRARSVQNLVPIKKGEHRIGRAKGQPNVLTRIVKEAILAAAEDVGNRLDEEAGKDPNGLVSYLEWAAMKQPAAYLALLGRVMPMQVEATNKDADVPYKTVEELQQALRDRGLPVERIYPLLEFEPLTQDVANEDGQ
jgi:hypothetical protein